MGSEETRKKLILFLAIGLMMFGVWICYDVASYRNVTLKFSENILEYGEEVDFNKLLKNKNITIKPKHYNPFKTGKQSVTFYVKKGNTVCLMDGHIFEVKDTKTPVIKLKKDTVEINYGDKYELKSNIEKVYDEIDGDIDYEFSGTVDPQKAGDYKIKVIAKDINGNKAEKIFTVKVKEEIPDVPETVIQAAKNNGVKINTKQHYINVSAIDSHMYQYKYTASIVESILNGGTKVYFSEEDTNLMDKSIVEVYLLYATTDFIGCRTDRDENGLYVIYGSDAVTDYQPEIIKMNNRRAVYKNYLRSVLSSMNLNTDDYTMVNQIHNYVKNKITYQKTSEHITWNDYYNTIDTGLGQCWQYAYLFRDLCVAAGIPCYYTEGYFEGRYHAWNHLYINGNRYWFDTTLNDSVGYNKWVWLTDSQIRRDHSW